MMDTQNAVAQRILQLCNERKIAVNSLAISAQIPPSTIYSMLHKKSQNPGTESLKKICDGFGISLREFFDCDLFGEKI